MRLGLNTGAEALKPRAPTPSRISLLMSKLHARQSNPTFTAIPSTYGQTGGPSPGAVAGIVLGAVAAFLLLLYLVYAILHGGPVGFRPGPATDDGGESTVGSRSVVSFRTRDTRRTSGRRRSHRNSRAETVEVRRSRATIVDPPAPAPPPPPPARTVSPLSDEDEIDVVIVEEEQTPPRRGSQRGWRRESGYRDVDPRLFASGDEPVVNVRRGSGRYARER